MILFIVLLIYLSLWFVKNMITLICMNDKGAFISIKNLNKYKAEVNFWDTYVTIHKDGCRGADWWSLFMGPITFGWFIFAFIKAIPAKEIPPWRIK